MELAWSIVHRIRMIHLSRISTSHLVASGFSLAAALSLVACSVELGPKEVSATELEKVGVEMLTEIAGRKPDALECPDALPAEAGSEVRCVLTDGKQRIGVTFTSKGVNENEEKVDISLQVDDKPMN